MTDAIFTVLNQIIFNQMSTGAGGFGKSADGRGRS